MFFELAAKLKAHEIKSNNNKKNTLIAIKQPLENTKNALIKEYNDLESEVTSAELHGKQGTLQLMRKRGREIESLIEQIDPQIDKINKPH